MHTAQDRSIVGDVTTGLRERKKQRTRQTIAAAALELAVAHGLAEVTVEQVAEAAEVSPRTFFNYFSSKEEAVVAADVDRAADLGERLAARPAEEPVLDAVRAVVHEMVSDAGPRQRDWLRQVRLVRANPALVPHQLAAYAAIERSLAAAIAERVGLAADGVYPTLTSAAVMAATRVASTRWLENDGTVELVACLDEALDLLVSGFAEPPPT